MIDAIAKLATGKVRGRSDRSYDGRPEFIWIEQGMFITIFIMIISYGWRGVGSLAFMPTGHLQGVSDWISTCSEPLLSTLMLDIKCRTEAELKPPPLACFTALSLLAIANYCS